MKEKQVTDKYTLSEERQRDLLNGKLNPEEDTDLEQLSDHLRQVKDLTEQKQAYITAITPPSVSAPSEPPTEKYNISVKFAIKEDTTFWKSYEYSDKHFSEKHPFSKLLQYLGQDLETLPKALGEPVPIEYTEDSWELDTKEIYNSVENQDESALDMLDEYVENIKTQVLEIPLYVLLPTCLLIPSLVLTGTIIPNIDVPVSSIPVGPLVMTMMVLHVMFIIAAIVFVGALAKCGELSLYLLKNGYNRSHQK